jgi:hypothetical protein
MPHLSSVISAQTASTSTEVKKFEVIAVDGNDLVVRLPEGTRQINVPQVSYLSSTGIRRR